MTPEIMKTAFNEWMRRYIENPEGYGREFQSVSEFLNDKVLGREPTYGETCAAYLTKLANELTFSSKIV